LTYFRFSSSFSSSARSEDGGSGAVSPGGLVGLGVPSEEGTVDAGLLCGDETFCGERKALAG
jgi:hypothetical protein